MTDQSTDGLNPSVRSVDLRIAIAEHYGFDFLGRVRQSNSNSLAAIQFTREHLDAIARDLGLDPDAIARKSECFDAIRRACGREPRAPDGFDWAELCAIVDAAGIPVADDVYYDCSAPAADGGEPEPVAEDDGEGTAGPWAGWDGGADD